MKRLFFVATLLVAGIVSAKEGNIPSKDLKNEISNHQFENEISNNVNKKVLGIFDFNEKSNAVAHSKCYVEDKSGNLHEVKCPKIIILR
ncbi:hypothetical protein OKE68_09875 [Riemerella anatipestifer]|uniref:Uncharacterized protein n=1 Tax=Riemerella anatipestifer TaxID=34085 RepID=A0AAP3EXB9_RIEAN|nr:hypothetical protein [Riemerella anatipestifer]MBT0572914.1 hypothetical protein [Riemerella anatipestifer]MCU7568926.1 hypothetical protein [Riemerella anatipestifer]MCW0490843.1 hypothetical protein [Riemerella anatipestifer]MCW0498259.1 hypothetical protein [Riemerella anatipestifer]MCW0524621.1 hypothetical protein [Riemerella anatipestifer]